MQGAAIVLYGTLSSLRTKNVLCKTGGLYFRESKKALIRIPSKGKRVDRGVLNV